MRAAAGGRRGGQRAAPPGPRRASVGLLLLGAMAAALVAGRIESALGALAVAAAAGAWAGATRPSRGWWLGVGGGMAIAFAFNLWLVEGRAIGLPVVLGHAATAEGAGLGALLALRLAGAAVAVRGLRAAWPGECAADEAARLLRPLERLRVPVRELRAMVGLALRMAPLLREEARRIGRLQTLRAGRAPRTLAERVTRARATLVPALVGALERAEQVSLALEARHWRSRPVPPGAPAGAWGVGGALLFVFSLCWRAR